MGGLWRCLERGEYGWLRECPLFESDFLQVTRSGEVASRVTVGIAATSASQALPDLMLLARLARPGPGLELFGLLPLQFVRLSLHSERLFQLRVRLASGRTFYLRLLAPPWRLERLFGCWLRLLELLRRSPAQRRDSWQPNLRPPPPLREP